MTPAQFTHLHVHTNFSFKDSTCAIEKLCQKAAQMGYDALAITDHNNLCGAIRFYTTARKYGLKPIIGAEITLETDYHLVLLAKNMTGYSNLCRLITAMHLAHRRHSPRCTLSMLKQYHQNLICLSGCHRSEIYTLLQNGQYHLARQAALQLANLFGKDHFYLEMQNRCNGESETMLHKLHHLAQELKLPVVATNNVHFIEREDFKVRDVLVCMSANIPLQQPHPDRHENDQCYLKSPDKMLKLFAKYPEAAANTRKITEMCTLELPLGEYRFPYFDLPDGHSAESYLRKLCEKELPSRYSPALQQTARQRLEHELAIINQLGFAAYFLVVWDIVRFARSRSIRCAGRGSAAGSIVAYLLNITHVCPLKYNLLFERFLNPERQGMPDIDIDFDSARRDEVIEYIYRKYDADKVAMVCTVNTISARSALREVGKALGFRKSEIDRIARYMPHVAASKIREAMENLPELAGHIPTREPWQTLIDICSALDNTPRHLGTHLGGLVISAQPLTDLVPLQWSSKGVIITQYDKDDIEKLGLVKMDILGLRILSVIEQSAQMAGIDIDSIPHNDQKTFELLRSTYTVGLFQLESPGMRNLLGRLQPTRFDDIIANISLFRPGPMQADMIDPFIKRRNGQQPVTYLHPKLRPILEETYGIIIYQEHVLQIGHAIAGFSLGQADLLRRAMTHDRSPAEMAKIKDTFLEGARKNGIKQQTAEAIFERVAAFAAYGFNKAHAASFGWLAYQTAYLKAHCPAEFFTAILNNQPMGFYPPRVIVNEARRMGIAVLPVDVCQSEYGCTVTVHQNQQAIRLGLMYVHGLSKTAADSIIQARQQYQFISFADFIKRTQIPLSLLEALIDIGAFNSLGKRGELLQQLDRLESLQKVQTKQSRQLMLNLQVDDTFTAVRDLSLREKVAYELKYLGCSISAHPLTFFADRIPHYTVKSRDLLKLANNSSVWVAGIIVSRQTPPTRSGQRIIFLTIEDETGLIDITVFPSVQLIGTNAKIALGASGLLIKGRLQRMGARGIAIIAEKLFDLAKLGSYRRLNVQKSSWNEIPGGRSKIVPT